LIRERTERGHARRRPHPSAEDVMAMKITDECISCGACEDECPNQAISRGDLVFIVDPARCSECVGAFDSPRCVAVCPIDDCVVLDADWPETRAQLEAKYAQLHA